MSDDNVIFPPQPRILVVPHYDEAGVRHGETEYIQKFEYDAVVAELLIRRENAQLVLRGLQEAVLATRRMDPAVRVNDWWQRFRDKYLRTGSGL